MKKKCFVYRSGSFLLSAVFTHYSFLNVQSRRGNLPKWNLYFLLATFFLPTVSSLVFTRIGRAAHVASDVASGSGAYLWRRGLVLVFLLVGHQGGRRVSAHGIIAHVVEQNKMRKRSRIRYKP